MKMIFSWLLCFAGLASLRAQSPDSLRLGIGQAEEIFLRKNLLLLARRYDADAARANEVQEKLYSNPVISAEIPLHGGNGKWFDAGSSGQKSFGIDQIILLAGKRNKRVSLAKEETQAANFAFYDLLRTLKYELRHDFYTLAYSSDLQDKYDDQMRLLHQIISAYDEQAARRNVPLKDAVRLKTEYIQLSADRNSIVMEAISAQQNLQLLLDTTAFIKPLLEPQPETMVLPPLALLLEKARQNRVDLQLQESQLKLQQLNYSLQKALAVPDLSVGAGYDQNGSYVSRLYTVRAAIGLPVFNRNQGNIRAAKAQIKSAELTRDYKQTGIEKEVTAGLARMQEAEREYQESRHSFNKDFPEMNRSVIENFNKGNISILDFLDFFENYNLAIRQLNLLQRQRQLAREELEFIAGSNLDN